jgi:Recombination endonuclease VII
MDEGFKRCADCKIEKKLADFGPTTQQLKFGVKSRCRECEREYKRRWVQADPVRRAKQDASTRAWQKSNREKVREWNKNYKRRRAAERPEQFRAYERKCRLKRTYGVTLEWVDEQFEKQGGRCAICRGLPGQKGLMIDHCHKSKKVRKLLCSMCNFSLHKLEQDIEWAEKAIAYLKENE